ncbi:hypothetical protein GCM10010394_45740 [Streptomyces crystallinus]|uniref:Uncharacterized protein n=1 Tax=Streptomyces crystallinus TaxID=68191 RepID=A0ABN1GFX2_9ACTN
MDPVTARLPPLVPTTPHGSMRGGALLSRFPVDEAQGGVDTVRALLAPRRGDDPLMDLVLIDGEPLLLPVEPRPAVALDHGPRPVPDELPAVLLRGAGGGRRDGCDRRCAAPASTRTANPDASEHQRTNPDRNDPSPHHAPRPKGVSGS